MKNRTVQRTISLHFVTRAATKRPVMRMGNLSISEGANYAKCPRRALRGRPPPPQPPQLRLTPSETFTRGRVRGAETKHDMNLLLLRMEQERLAFLARDPEQLITRPGANFTPPRTPRRLNTTARRLDASLERVHAESVARVPPAPRCDVTAPARAVELSLTKPGTEILTSSTWSHSSGERSAVTGKGPGTETAAATTPPFSLRLGIYEREARGFRVQVPTHADDSLSPQYDIVRTCTSKVAKQTDVSRRGSLSDCGDGGDGGGVGRNRAPWAQIFAPEALTSVAHKSPGSRSLAAREWTTARRAVPVTAQWQPEEIAVPERRAAAVEMQRRDGLVRHGRTRWIVAARTAGP
ncbi:unnamed protein product [Lampetra planeri]